MGAEEQREGAMAVDIYIYIFEQNYGSWCETASPSGAHVGPTAKSTWADWAYVYMLEREPIIKYDFSTSLLFKLQN
jgi:hypothetical protein